MVVSSSSQHAALLTLCALLPLWHNLFDHLHHCLQQWATKSSPLPTTHVAQRVFWLVNSKATLGPYFKRGRQRASAPFAPMHDDMLEPYPTPSIGGALCMFMLVNDCGKFTWRDKEGKFTSKESLQFRSQMAFPASWLPHRLHSRVKMQSAKWNGHRDGSRHAWACILGMKFLERSLVNTNLKPE